MPENPYDDRKVSLRGPHGNGDLDIVGAVYTRRKANVTEALLLDVFCYGIQFYVYWISFALVFSCMYTVESLSLIYLFLYHRR